MDHGEISVVFDEEIAVRNIPRYVYIGQRLVAACIRPGTYLDRTQVVLLKGQP